jgi:hypothetical protein
MAKSQSVSPLGLRLVPPYERFWHAETHLYGGRAAVFNSVLGLRDAKYLLLESERADGTWVGTTMWFAAVNDTLFLRTVARSAKVRRMSRRPIVKAAACTMRGKPLDDQIECRGRLVPGEREAQGRGGTWSPLRAAPSPSQRAHQQRLRLPRTGPTRPKRASGGRTTALRSRESERYARTASNPKGAGGCPPEHSAISHASWEAG